MKIVLKICDKYLPLLKIYPHLFNKYWPNQIVDVVCFKEPDFEVPSNFQFYSVGNEEDFDNGRIWADPIKMYLDDAEDEYILLLLDDLFLIDYVSDSKIEMCLDLMSTKKIEKIIIGQVKTGFKPYNKDFELFPKHIVCRTTTKPSIWKKSYLLKLLKPGYTIWDFESKNDLVSKTDGSVILQSKRILFNNFNVIVKGRLNIDNGLANDRKNPRKRTWYSLKDEDIEELRKLANIWEDFFITPKEQLRT